MIAHRTCPRDAPENSIAGIRCAALLGAEYVEVDVRRTRDGVPVLLHDPLLLRTARWPVPIRLLTSRTVRPIRLRRSSATLPTLEEAVASLESEQGLVLDVKDPGAMPAAIAVVRAARALDRTLLWSQHERAVTDALHLAPGVEVALLRDTGTAPSTAGYVRDASRIGARAVSLHQDAATAELVDLAHAAGLRVYAWAQSEDRTRSVLDAGIDGIVTDWPAAARRLLDG